MQQAPPVERTRPSAASEGAVLAGSLIGPGLGALILTGFGPGAGVAALLLLGATAAGVRGAVRAVLRWRSADAAERAGAGAAEVDQRAAAFARPAQRGSAALAVLLLAIGAATAIGWAFATAHPPTGPVDGVDDVLVPALGALALSACIVPVLLAQASWTRRPGAAEAEAAVLAGRVPGPRRLVRAARGTALTAWTLAAAAGAITAVLLVQSAVQQTSAVLTAYSQRQVSSLTGIELSGGGWLVAGVRCPATAPLLRRTVLTCTLTTLGRPATVRVVWTPSLSGVGTSSLQEGSARHLVSATDLAEPAPPLRAPQRQLSRADVERQVRAAITAAGYDAADPRLSGLRCPGIGQGYDGFVRCDLGTGYDVRSLDVYPDGEVVRPRLAELADLRP